MKRSLMDILVDPVCRSPLLLEATEGDAEEVMAGCLMAENGTKYPVTLGIPRLVATGDPGQLQTGEAFGFKWHKRNIYDYQEANQFQLGWLPAKYGFESLEDWAGYYSSRRRILDLGCGSGASSLWLDQQYWSGEAMWVGADISSAIDIAKERLGHLPNTHFIQTDALQLPFPCDSFDTIFAEGVLHHTPSTREAIRSAARVLEPGGEFHFYVYRRKGPIREFTDDYVREAIASLPAEQALEAIHSLTQLGQALSQLHVEVEVPDVPILGITAGRYDVQRLVYWHFAKLFWNEATSFDYNALVNFDWYYPRYAHRQTEEEVRQWCLEAGLTVRWFHTQESGFTVIAIKDG